MTIDPFISFAIWFIGAVAATCIVTLAAKDHHDLTLGVFVAMTWPGWLVIAVIFSPVWIGLAVAKLVRHLSRKGKP